MTFYDNLLGVKKNIEEKIDTVNKRIMLRDENKIRNFAGSGYDKREILAFRTILSEINYLINEFNREMEKITPEILHEWYLESTKPLNPQNYNTNAQKSYNELAEEQKSIDKFIANKIRNALR